MNKNYLGVKLTIFFLLLSGVSCNRNVAAVSGVDRNDEISYKDTRSNADVLPLYHLNHSSYQEAAESPVLFSYLVKSTYTVRAYATKSEHVGLVNKTKGDPNKVYVGENVAGFVYSFDVARLLCSKDSFGKGRQHNPDSIERFQIFVPFGKFFYEDYRIGREYLIFLERIPIAEKLWERYEVERKAKFFRAYEGNISIFTMDQGSIEGPPRRGIIDLTNNRHKKLVERVESVCQALRVRRVGKKLENLRRLADSPDEELRENAEYAIRWFSSRKPH